MTNADIKRLRDRTWLALDQNTANAMGCSVPQLQQWLVGAYRPTAEQLQSLARYHGCCR